VILICQLKACDVPLDLVRHSASSRIRIIAAGIAAARTAALNEQRGSDINK
jgi:hypothetical protein